MRLVRPILISLFAGLGLLLAGCENNSGPWLAFDGGGFVFNYRTAQVFYGFNVRLLRTLANGTVLVAEFQDPAGGPDLVVRDMVRPNTDVYSFQSPALTGVEAHKPYKGTIKILEAGTNKLIASYERDFKSQVGQDWLPEKPLVVGPGYKPNPEL